MGVKLEFRGGCSRWGALLATLLLVSAVAVAAPTPLRADSDIEAEETDESINNAVKALRRDQHEAETVRSRLKTLNRQQENLQYRKRTGAPFQSQRSLRHDLRRSEAQQGWQKHEDRRLDHEIRRGQQDIRTGSQDWRRER